MNEGLAAWMVTKDLGETVGTLVTRAARENLVTRARQGRWELADSQAPRVNLALQGFLVSRDPRGRMEPLVSGETKETSATWVPGASRENGA